MVHQLKRRLDIDDLFFSFCVVSEVCSYVNLFVTRRERAAAELASGAVVVRIEEYVRLQLERERKWSSDVWILLRRRCAAAAATGLEKLQLVIDCCNQLKDNAGRKLHHRPYHRRRGMQQIIRGSCWDSGARQDESRRVCELLQQQQPEM